MHPCPCHSGKLYSTCCQPYHSQQESPQTALALMRSRYSAYALHLVDYIIQTTHPQNPQFNQKSDKELLHFCQNTEFIDLKILDFTDVKEEAFVTFRAILKQSGKDISFTEKSHFKKKDSQWLYYDASFS